MDTFEKPLIDDIDNDKSESFSELFERYHKKIYVFAYKMLGNAQDADDIIQSTFMQAFTHLEEFREESSVYTWLYAIARNQCLRLLENRKRRSFYSLDMLVNSIRQPESADVFSEVEKRTYISQVREGCLASLLICLPVYQRLAFVLQVLLGCRAKDVAKILDKSETATRMLVHRARKNIKSFLCKNCSCYIQGNPCRCENLIHFSLQRGWIHSMPSRVKALEQAVPVDRIEKEIDELKKITLLYNSLEDYQPSDGIVEHIRKEISAPGKILANR